MGKVRGIGAPLLAKEERSNGSNAQLSDGAVDDVLELNRHDVDGREHGREIILSECDDDIPVVLLWRERHPRREVDEWVVVGLKIHSWISAPFS